MIKIFQSLKTIKNFVFVFFFKNSTFKWERWLRWQMKIAEKKKKKKKTGLLTNENSTLTFDQFRKKPWLSPKGNEKMMISEISLHGLVQTMRTTLVAAMICAEKPLKNIVTGQEAFYTRTTRRSTTWMSKTCVGFT